MNNQTDNRQAGLVFAADLGGTHLRAAVVDATGKILTQLKKSTPKASGPECVVRELVNAERQCRTNVTLANANVVAAAIMVPGSIDRENAVVVRAPNLPSLNNFGLKEALQREFGRPVFLENDANAAAVGEMWLGAARGYRNIICVTLGTGVGGGIILDGKLFRGSDGSGGELGHTAVNPFSGIICKCGNEGCLEVFASATAIVRMAKEDLAQYPQSLLKNQEFTAEKIYEAGRKGDALAIAVFERAGMYLGVALSNLINLLNPEIIVIGGGVANGWDLFESSMRKTIAKRAFPAAAEHVKIVSAECGDNAGLLGAARLAFDGGAAG